MLFNSHAQTRQFFDGIGVRGGLARWMPLSLSEDEAGHAVLARQIISNPELAARAGSPVRV